MEGVAATVRRVAGLGNGRLGNGGVLVCYCKVGHSCSAWRARFDAAAAGVVQRAMLQIQIAIAQTEGRF